MVVVHRKQKRFIESQGKLINLTELMHRKKAAIRKQFGTNSVGTK